MDGNGNPRQSSWTQRVRAQEPRWRQIVIAIGIAVFVVQGARIAVEPRGDFGIHWELGRRFAQGQFIYFADGKLDESPDATAPRLAKDYPYPPFWAFAHAPLTLLPKNLAQLAVYPLCAVSLVALLWILGRMTEHTLPAERRTIFWISVAAIALASRFLIRDMPECGVNLALVTLSWGAVYLWSQRREFLGGASLGLAIALKCTPALFLAYFVWKRQWKMAATTTCAVAMFTLSPMLMMGPSLYGKAMQFWFVHAWEGFGNPDPSMGVLGAEQIQNVSLRPALRAIPHASAGRACLAARPSFVLRRVGPAPATAGLVIKLILLALVGGIAWRFRGPVVQRDDVRICWECAAASILILLLSPITWGQHCVGTLPVLYLIVRSHSSARRHPRWIYLTMGGLRFVDVDTEPDAAWPGFDLAVGQLSAANLVSARAGGNCRGLSSPCVRVAGRVARSHAAVSAAGIASGCLTPAWLPRSLKEQNRQQSKALLPVGRDRQTYTATKISLFPVLRRHSDAPAGVFVSMGWGGTAAGSVLGCDCGWICFGCVV